MYVCLYVYSISKIPRKEEKKRKESIYDHLSFPLTVSSPNIYIYIYIVYTYLPTHLPTLNTSTRTRMRRIRYKMGASPQTPDARYARSLGGVLTIYISIYTIHHTSYTPH